MRKSPKHYLPRHNDRLVFTGRRLKAVRESIVGGPEASSHLFRARFGLG